MAYDKIIPIRCRMMRCIDYVLNEDKTDLANALHYTKNPMKTQRLVTGVNCTPETALEEMNATKRRWDKTGGVLGYHIIHSYAPGEVTPEEAHAAGVELAERLLGDRYEAVVSTHLDREHLHCHIVFNSVSFLDGRKYRDDFKSYFEDLRGTSNEVSRAHGVTTILVHIPTVVPDAEGRAVLEVKPGERESFRRLSEENGLVFLDLTDRFVSALEEDHELLFGFANTAPGRGHINSRGHELFAEGVYGLIENGEG